MKVDQMNESVNRIMGKRVLPSEGAVSTVGGNGKAIDMNLKVEDTNAKVDAITGGFITEATKGAPPRMKAGVKSGVKPNTDEDEPYESHGVTADDAGKKGMKDFKGESLSESTEAPVVEGKKDMEDDEEDEDEMEESVEVSDMLESICADLAELKESIDPESALAQEITKVQESLGSIVSRLEE